MLNSPRNIWKIVKWNFQKIGWNYNKCCEWKKKNENFHFEYLKVFYESLLRKFFSAKYLCKLKISHKFKKIRVFKMLQLIECNFSMKKKKVQIYFTVHFFNGFLKRKTKKHLTFSILYYLIDDSIENIVVWKQYKKCDVPTFAVQSNWYLPWQSSR